MEEFVLEFHRIVPNANPAQRTQMVDRFSSDSRRITQLEWTYVRPGGCGELRAELLLPFDYLGTDAKTWLIQNFHRVVLYWRGVRWWQGYVSKVAPRLAVPESVTITAHGYGSIPDRATISWSFSRQTLKYVGEVGEIAGVVRSLYLLSPLLLGTDPLMPHPYADTFEIHGSAVRPRALLFDHVSLSEVFTEVATLAGNYDWGVDENRQFFFHTPEPWTAGTAVYTTQPAVSTWSTSTVHPYGDETYRDPQAVPPHLPVQEEAVVLMSGDVSAVDHSADVETAKNALLVIAAPLVRGGPPQLMTVLDPEWLKFWGQKLEARVSTPFFAESTDVQAWAKQRLRLLGRPQVQATVRFPYRLPTPLHATGALRLVDTEHGREIEERVLSVRYTLQRDAALLCSVELAYQPPADQYFAEQLRRDATLAQNSLAGDRVPFILTQHMVWPVDSWTAQIA